jgi:hypothetical protein
MHPEDEVRENFYVELSLALKDIDEHSFIICGGDFNARLGADLHISALSIDCNENGLLLQDFLNENEMISTLSDYGGTSKNRLWTFGFPIRKSTN